MKRQLSSSQLTCLIIFLYSVVGLSGCWFNEKEPEALPTPEVVTEAPAPKPESEPIKKEEVKKKDNPQADVNLDDLDHLLTKMSVKEEEKSKASSAWGTDMSYAQDRTLAKSISKGLATGFNHEMKSSYKWDDEQKKCFGRLGDNFAINEVQALLLNNLNEKEYKKATEFQKSSVGQKIDKWALKNLDDVIDGYTNVTAKDLNLSKQEKKIFLEYRASTAERKLARLLSGYRIETIVINKTKSKLAACDMI